MKHYIRIPLLLLLVFGAFSFAGVPPEKTSIDPPENILFIGNSFTYYNNSVHNRLRNLMKAGGKKDGIIRAWTLSGAELVDHAPGITAMVESEKWDVVILQGNSLESIQKDKIKMFQRVSRRYQEIIEESGAETVFFMTWAYEDHPEYSGSLNRSYTMIGNHVNSLVVPVGAAFELATNDYPEIGLRTSDKKHPTLAGTYLAACTFYAAFFKESPEGLDYDAGLNEDTALLLQTIAWDAAEAYYGGNE
jgi:hypothetical protein